MSIKYFAHPKGREYDACVETCMRVYPEGIKENYDIALAAYTFAELPATIWLVLNNKPLWIVGSSD